jgi:MFS family permease
VSRNFRRDMRLLFLANLIWGLGFNMYLGFFPIFLRSNGTDNYWISVVMSIPGFFGILSLLGGFLADRIDRKALLIFGWAVTIPAPLVWSLTNQFGLIIAGQVIYSLTEICIPAIALYIMDYNTEDNKLFAFSLVSMAGTIGSVVAPSIGGLFIQWIGIRGLFAAVFILFVIATSCLLPISSQKPLYGGRAEKIRRKPLDHFQWLKEFKAILPFVVFLALLPPILNIAEPYLPLFLKEYRNLSEGLIGIHYSLFFLGSSLLTWLLGNNSRKMPFQRTILIASGISLCSSVLFLTGSGSAALLIAFLLRGVNKSMPILTHGYFSSQLTGRNKGLLYAIMISIESFMIGMSAYPGAILYKLNPLGCIIAEILLLSIWVMTSFLPAFSGFLRIKQES